MDIYGDPLHDPMMLGVNVPPPSHEVVNVRKMRHRDLGKSANISRVESTVSGAISLARSKMMAAVSGHFVCFMTVGGLQRAIA
jgi:hypothetical protein